jgi:nitronate monooxygenase
MVLPVNGFASRIGKTLDLAFPLIQAPMAGGPTTPELVAEVSNSGALGSLGAAYLSPAVLRKTIEQIRNLTSRPFAVNLFIPTGPPEISEAQWTRMLQITRPYREQLELSDPPMPPRFSENFDHQLEVILDLRPKVFSFTFGVPSKKQIEQCHEREILLEGTATTLEEARRLHELGVDWICAQGAEAGGHRGTFIHPEDDRLLGLVPLVREICREIPVPVVAAGGIMDGSGVAAVLALGADAVQLGTAFLACKESGVSAAFRAVLTDPGEKETALTRAFSGRWARGIKNRVIRELSSHEKDILPFPAQNFLTGDIRKKAAEKGRSEFLSLWAGQGVNQIRELRARELIEALQNETRAALAIRATPAIGLLSVTAEMIDGAIADSSRLSRLLNAAIAPNWVAFPESLPYVKNKLAEDSGWEEWGTVFFVLQEPRTLIGMGGFMGAPSPDGTVEIGYSIAPDFRGRGLATAAARQLILRAFASSRVRAVDAHTRPERNASTRVLEKVGMRLLGETSDPKDGLLWHWRLERSSAHQPPSR